MSISSRYEGVLLSHVSSLPIGFAQTKTKVLGGLFRLGVYFMVQAYALDEADLKASGARLGTKCCEAFRGAVGANYRALYPWRDVLIEPFMGKPLGQLDQHEIRKTLTATLDSGAVDYDFDLLFHR